MSEVLKDRIANIVERELPDESYYLVGVDLSERSGKQVVNVYVDGDQGVTIEICAEISRALSNEIEEDNLIEDAFVLEVSSPGVDIPLQTPRQYQKNLGRDLLVYKQDGTQVLGTLLEMDEETLKLNAKEKAKGKSKQLKTREVSLPWTEIEKSIVQVSFK